MLDHRTRVVDHASASDRAGEHEAIARRAIRVFFLTWIASAAILYGIGFAINGVEEGRRAVIALACSLPGALTSLLIGLRAPRFAPQTRVVLIASGSVIRLISTVLLSALAWCVILSTRTAGFCLWVVIGYGLTLIVDVALLLRVIKNEATGRDQSQ